MIDLRYRTAHDEAYSLGQASPPTAIAELNAAANSDATRLNTSRALPALGCTLDTLLRLLQVGGITIQLALMLRNTGNFAATR